MTTSTPATTAFGPVVADADVPVLLVAVAHLTGDLSLLRDEFRPDHSNLFDPTAGLSQQAMDEGRALAAQALEEHASDLGRVVPPPTDDQLDTMIAFLVGDETCAIPTPSCSARSWRFRGPTCARRRGASDEFAPARRGSASP